MSRTEGEQRTPEQEHAWLLSMQQQFRQAYHMGRIFCELRKSEENEYYHDHETGRVLFDSSSMPEGIPAYATQFIDPEKAKEEKEAWDNRTKEIVNATKTWLRILDDGALEIKYEHSRYDQGYITPTVDLDDVPEALSAMTCSVRARKEKEGENPMEAFADRISRSPHIVLRRSEQIFILRPQGTSGTVETSRWEQEYDYDGNITKDEVIEPVVYPVGNGNTDRDLMTLRFNMMSKLRYELNKAVESEAPEHYAARFTLPARQAILTMALSEIQIAAENGEKKNEKEEARVHGHCEFRGDFICPQADYSRFRTTTDENGIITVENTHIAHDLSEAYFADAIELPAPTSKDEGFGTLMRASDVVYQVVDDWKKRQKEKWEKRFTELELRKKLKDLKLLW